MVKLVCGVGINDASYPVKPVKQKGSKDRVVCPFYKKWKAMIERCYSKKYQKHQPTYDGCEVCANWLVFSNFKQWMESQDWIGKDLDKDILKIGNRIYSEENCVLVSETLNGFLINNAYKKKSDYMLGVSISTDGNRFVASCQNPFTGKAEYLGRFERENEAHQAWKKRKHELACQLAELQTDERVANALRTRYL